MTNRPADSGLLRHDTPFCCRQHCGEGSEPARSELYIINTSACVRHGGLPTRILVPACPMLKPFGAAGGVVEELNEPELQLEGEGGEPDDAAVIGLEE